MKQTTTINGKRVVLTRKAGKLTVAPAPVLEWQLQAAAVSALRRHPDFNRTFTMAGDFNAGRRGSTEQTKAKATGLTPGEPDLRLYLTGGRMLFIEYKTTTGRLSPEQRERHALLRALGFQVEVIKAATPEECAAATLALLDAAL
jgi:hypothetical protein